MRTPPSPGEGQPSQMSQMPQIYHWSKVAGQISQVIHNLSMSPGAGIFKNVQCERETEILVEPRS